MQSGTLIDPSPPIIRGAARWRLYVSRAPSAFFVFLFLTVHPLCYCLHYYVELSLLGLVPLAFGPRLYRWLGVAIIVAGLLYAEGDRRDAIRHDEQVRQVQAEADAQLLREHPERRPSPVPR